MIPGVCLSPQTKKTRRKPLKRLIKEYQQLLTSIEERIECIGCEMKTEQTKEGLIHLRKRRELLKEEYDDLIYAMRKMSKYTDDNKNAPIRPEVKSA